MATHSAVINVMLTVVRKASRPLLRDFGEIENLQTSRKGPGDFVTKADLRTDRILVEELTKARPRFGVISEEGGERAGEAGEPVWVIDPIDGTANLTHGLPHFAISVALVQDGTPMAGVIYDPIADDMYWAERGIGAYLNDRRIRVSARRQLDDCLIATGFPNVGEGGHERHLAELGAIGPAVAGIRAIGSAALALAYVAAGRFDAYWDRNLQAWDTAAGALLVREAGGTVSDLAGRAQSVPEAELLAGGLDVHDLLRRQLRNL